jgi:hypothetical protein
MRKKRGRGPTVYYACAAPVGTPRRTVGPEEALSDERLVGAGNEAPMIGRWQISALHDACLEEISTERGLQLYRLRDRPYDNNAEHQCLRSYDT